MSPYQPQFNPKIAQLTQINNLSLNNMSSTCFGLGTAIIREVSNQGI